MRRLFLTAALLGVVLLSKAQNQPVIIEAEAGSLGSDWELREEGDTKFIAPKTDSKSTEFPGVTEKIATYSIAFPKAGAYELYIRVRVGAGGAKDDSFYYGKSFGKNDVSAKDSWVTCNGLFDKGYSNLDLNSVVEGLGEARSKEWKWINLSRFTGLQKGVSFKVKENALTQIFQIGAREDGLEIDKIIFAPAKKFFTVQNLALGEPGSDNKPAPIE